MLANYMLKNTGALNKAVNACKNEACLMAHAKLHHYSSPPLNNCDEEHRTITTIGKRGAKSTKY